MSDRVPIDTRSWLEPLARWEYFTPHEPPYDCWVLFGDGTAQSLDAAYERVEEASAAGHDRLAADLEAIGLVIWATGYRAAYTLAIPRSELP